MIDKFGKILLSMVALLVFQAYLYVSQPPTNDLYFILITILAAFLGLILNLTFNHNIHHVINRVLRGLANIIRFRKKSDIERSFIGESTSLLLDEQREYSVLSISLTSFIAINIVFALIYM